MKVQFNSFHLNGHTLGFHPQTLELEPLYTSSNSNDFRMMTRVVFNNFYLCCRDEEFSVSGVLAADVIHANRKDLQCIFRVGVFITPRFVLEVCYLNSTLIVSKVHLFSPLTVFTWQTPIVLNAGKHASVSSTGKLHNPYQAQENTHLVPSVEKSRVLGHNCCVGIARLKKHFCPDRLLRVTQMV